MALPALSHLFSSVNIWWHSRPRRHLLPSFPALIAFAVCVVGILQCAPVGEEQRTAGYLERGQDALRAGDFATALTCFERLAQGANRRLDIQYGLGLAAAGLGQIERTRLLMGELAPLDQRGHPPAHFWVARQLLAESLPSPQVREQARIHLLRALEGDIEDPSLAHGLLCELYMIDGQFDLAEPHLSKAVGTRPQLRMRSAHLYALRGDKNRARHEAELAVEYFREAARTEDSRGLNARIRWAEALTFLERFPEALQVLDKGIAQSPDPALVTAWADIHAAWYDTLSRESGDTLSQRLSVLEEGLRRDPNNPQLLNRLLALTRLDGPNADQVRAMLRALLAKGQSPGAIHFVLSLDALQRKQTTEARLHLEQAIQRNPDLPVVANNLAWILAHEEKPDLARALSLAQLAVDRAPQNLSFRHTRGFILAKMGRWKEALPDLEAVLPQRQGDPSLHQLLAQAYEVLGAPDMAKEHRRLAVVPSGTSPKPPGP